MRLLLILLVGLHPMLRLYKREIFAGSGNFTSPCDPLESVRSFPICLIPLQGSRMGCDCRRVIIESWRQTIPRNFANTRERHPIWEIRHLHLHKMPHLFEFRFEFVRHFDETGRKRMDSRIFILCRIRAKFSLTPDQKGQDLLFSTPGLDFLSVKFCGVIR